MVRRVTPASDVTDESKADANAGTTVATGGSTSAPSFVSQVLQTPQWGRVAQVESRTEVRAMLVSKEATAPC